jgi:hypothetical protein
MTTKILSGVSSDYDAYIIVANGMVTPAQFKTIEEANRFLFENDMRPLGADCDAFQMVEGAGKTFLRIVAAPNAEVDEWETWN